MKTTLVSLLLLLTLPLSASAQRLKETGKQVKDLVPEGWTTQEAWGDLYKNGRNDLVLMAVPNDPAGITKRDDGYELNENQPVLAIYYMSEEGDLIKHYEYDNVIPPLASLNYFTDVTLEVTNRGTLIIDLSTMYTAGSYTSPRHSYVFRRQNDDFYLIGEDISYYTRTTGEGEQVSINYLTSKKSSTKLKLFDEPIENGKTVWSKISRKPLRKLGSFTLEN